MFVFSIQLCMCVFIFDVFFLQHCLMTVCSSALSELGLQLLINLLALRDCSYWLVRTELLETLAEMDFRYDLVKNGLHSMTYYWRQCLLLFMCVLD